VLELAFGWFEAVLIVYVSVGASVHFLMIVGAYFAMRNDTSRLGKSEIEAVLKSPLLPGVTVLAPAYNEEMAILESVQSMLRLRHPNHEVIVINDGSTDRTLSLLVARFRLYKSSRTAGGRLSTGRVRGVYESRDPIRLLVVDKENGGKADSLNAGLNYSRHPLFATVDADSLLERDALVGMSRPFLESDDVVGAGGIIRVVNGCRVEHGQVTDVRAPRTLLARLQTIEYLRAFLGGRVAFSAVNSLLVISGAFGVFKRDIVIAAGGFDVQSVGEDMEIVVRLHALGCQAGQRHRMVFVPEPVCWTEVPETLRTLRRQRTRWQRAAIESLHRHRSLLCHPRGGALGWVAFPHFLLFEVYGPVVELVGYVATVVGLAFGLVSPAVAFQFFFVSIVFNMALSIGALVIDELTARKYPRAADLGALMAAAFVESFGYRQLTGVWRLEGIIDSARGKKGWGVMERRGFGVKGARA
jgi:cellulose synthase/poly-beta-1,6-N-acetylglucosamine synthase-like glycosyltransferase